MSFDSHKNFAASTVGTAPSPASSGTSLVLSADFSPAPTPPYNIVICPASTAPTPANAEIARVTADSSGTLTITRAQEGTSARTVVVGDQVFAAVTAKTLTDIESASAIGNSSGGLSAGVIAATLPRSGALSTNMGGTSGTLYLLGINLRFGVTITSIGFVSSNSLVSGTHQIFGLYDDHLGSSSGTARALLAQTSDDTSTAWSSNTAKVLNLTSAYTTTRAGFFYLGMLVVAGTATQLRATTADSICGALAPTLCGVSDASLTALSNPAGAPSFGGGAYGFGYVV